MGCVIMASQRPRKHGYPNCEDTGSSFLEGWLASYSVLCKRLYSVIDVSATHPVSITHAYIGTKCIGASARPSYGCATGTIGEDQVGHVEMKQRKTARQCSVHSCSPTRRRVERHCARIPVDARMPNTGSVTTQGSVGSHKQPQTVLSNPEPVLSADAAFAPAASECMSLCSLSALPWQGPPR